MSATRVIDRPELRALSPIGEVERLERELAAMTAAKDRAVETLKTVVNSPRIMDTSAEVEKLCDLIAELEGGA